MTATAHPELRQPTFICPISATADSAMKQFLPLTKNILSPVQFVCPMKQAIDLALKSKPPLIKPIPGDIMNLPGNLVSLVVVNWLAVQLRKPPPKAPQKRGNASRKGSRTAQPEIPAKTEPEHKGPFIVFITDYPRSVEQYKEVIDQQAPIVCHININGGTMYVDKKASNSQNSLTFAHDLKKALSDRMKFFEVKYGSDIPVDQQFKDVIQNIYSVYNGYVEYKNIFSNTCYVNIPSYPKEPILLPQLPPEKPVRQRVDKSGAPPPPPTPPPFYQTDALKAAYKSMLFTEIDEHLKKNFTPYFSSSFQHYAENFPAFPLPAKLAQILSIIPDFRSNEIFLMRGAADRNGIDFDIIFRVMVKKKVEEMIGYSIGQRNYKEYFKIEILPNIIGPLFEQFSEFKYTEYAGKLILVFYQKFPHRLQVLKREDSFSLPIYTGFGKWYDSKGPFSSDAIDINFPKDIGINVGNENVFMGLEFDTTKRSSTHYFCESGLEIVTYKPKVSHNLLENLIFYLTFCQTQKFSFRISQHPPTLPPEEEEDDIPETSLFIRGVICKNIEFCFDYETEKINFSVIRKQSKIEIDIVNKVVIISGVPGERHRVYTQNGKVIKYAPDPIIYSSDGSITHRIRGGWKMVDAEGKGYIKRNGKWYLEPKFDVTSNTKSTYFTKRKVTNRTDGLTYIEDEDENEDTFVFPDGTRFNKLTNTFYHKKIPSVKIDDKKIIIEAKEFTIELSNNSNCTFTLKNQESVISYTDDDRHLLIQYGTSGNILTLIDLLSGYLVNLCSRRLLYYLSEDWKWKVGKMLCSKKEMLQHFHVGDHLERIQEVKKLETEEIESIISTGQSPRIFIVEKDFNDFNVHELLTDASYKIIYDHAINQSNNNQNETNITLWYDTKPRSFRELRVLPKITPEIEKEVEDALQKENMIKVDQKEASDYAVDPKWRTIENDQVIEEDNMKELYEKFGIDIENLLDPLNTPKSDDSSVVDPNFTNEENENEDVENNFKEEEN